ncbi:MAG: hypothetical protein J6O50_06110 [Ruminiclostridium sp.]|nr:hypothetical protein [Ruminiclostridium sp.]
MGNISCEVSAAAGNGVLGLLFKVKKHNKNGRSPVKVSETFSYICFLVIIIDIAFYGKRRFNYNRLCKSEEEYKCR